MRDGEVERMGLQDRVVLITGGGRGIGRACAVGFGRLGAKVAVMARTREELEETTRLVSEAGGEALSFTADLEDPETPRVVTKAVADAWGPVEVLVNNAGIAPTAKLVDQDLEGWERVLRVNLTAAFLACRAVLPAMLEARWGRIVSVASTAAKVGSPYTAAYTASKHGLLGLSRTLAAETAGTGVTVNAVCPGYARTRLTGEAAERVAGKTGRSSEEILEGYAERNPIGRLIEPEEVARAVLFLAAEGSNGIHGQALNVDGGAVTI